MPSLVAVLAAGSEAELFQLQEKNLRLKAELEQATGTLKVILDKVEAFDRRSCSGGTCSEPRIAYIDPGSVGPAFTDEGNKFCDTYTGDCGGRCGSP